MHEINWKLTEQIFPGSVSSSFHPCQFFSGCSVYFFLYWFSYFFARFFGIFFAFLLSGSAFCSFLFSAVSEVCHHRPGFICLSRDEPGYCRCSSFLTSDFFEVLPFVQSPAAFFNCSIVCSFGYCGRSRYWLWLENNDANANKATIMFFSKSCLMRRWY